MSYPSTVLLYMRIIVYENFAVVVLVVAVVVVLVVLVGCTCIFKFHDE